MLCSGKRSTLGAGEKAKWASTCCTSIGTRVRIPSAHVKKQAWHYTLVPMLGGSWCSLASQSSSLVNCRFRKRHCLKTLRWETIEESPWLQPLPPRDMFTHRQVYPYTHGTHRCTDTYTGAPLAFLEFLWPYSNTGTVYWSHLCGYRDKNLSWLVSGPLRLWGPTIPTPCHVIGRWGHA